VRFRRIHPEPGETTAGEAVATLGLRDAAPDERPIVAVNMVASVDGRAAVDGGTRGMSGPADRALFHALRAEVDAVLVGAGTARVERYGRLVREPAAREARRARGLAPNPLLCVVSGRLDLPPDLPFLGEPEQPVLVLTESEAREPEAAGALEVRRSSPLDLAGELERLRRERGVEALLCEGGPTLNAALLARGLVDVLLLTLAPTLTAAAAPAIVAPDPSAGRPLSLLRALEHDGALFLAYGVGT
jgi:riboflavin biosynthesis pyrimidine reductase